MGQCAFGSNSADSDRLTNGCSYTNCHWLVEEGGWVVDGDGVVSDVAGPNEGGVWSGMGFGCEPEGWIADGNGVVSDVVGFNVGGINWNGIGFGAGANKAVCGHWDEWNWSRSCEVAGADGWITDDIGSADGWVVDDRDV